MTLQYIYKVFPDEVGIFEILENIVWGDEVSCPYCGSTHITAYRSSNRYHCNTCKTSFTATVNTLFHKTKVDLQKWIYLFWILANNESPPSLRNLANEMHVTKDTVSRMISAIRNEYSENSAIIIKLLNHINHAG